MEIDDQVIRHLRRTWDFNEFHAVRLDFPFVRGVVDDLWAVRVDPLIPERGVWVYVTAGAWRVRCEPDRREFLIVSPCLMDTHFATLAEVVFRHAVPNNPLDAGDVYNLGRSWLDNSPSTNLLLSRPYILDPAVEIASLDGMTVRYLWLLPINNQERAYLESRSLEALEQAFEAQGIKPLDPHRESVV